MEKETYVFHITLCFSYVRLMSFGQGGECWNWSWMSNICYCYLFLLRLSFTIWGTFKVLWGCLNSKEIIFSALYYFQIWFSCRLKKSNKHSSLNLSFDALSKWHEPNIRRIIFQNLYHVWKSMSFCKECHPFDQQSVNLKLFLLSRVELCLLRNFKCITALHTLPISFIYHNKFHCN